MNFVFAVVKNRQYNGIIDRGSDSFQSGLDARQLVTITVYRSRAVIPNSSMGLIA